MINLIYQNLPIGIDGKHLLIFKD